MVRERERKDEGRTKHEPGLSFIDGLRTTTYGFSTDRTSRALCLIWQYKRYTPRGLTLPVVLSLWWNMDFEEQLAQGQLAPPTQDFLATVKVFPLIPYLKKDVAVSHVPSTRSLLILTWFAELHRFVLLLEIQSH